MSMWRGQEGQLYEIGEMGILTLRTPFNACKAAALDIRLVQCTFQALSVFDLHWSSSVTLGQSISVSEEY